MDLHEAKVLENVNEKVTQIHGAVFGIESQGGLLRKVEQHEAAIKELDNFKTKILASVVVIILGVEVLLKIFR